MLVDSLRYVHDSRATAPHTHNNYQQNSKLLCIQSEHVSCHSLRIKVNTRSFYHRSSPYAYAFWQITYSKYINKLMYTEANKSVVWFNCTTSMLISQASSSNIPNLIINKPKKKNRWFGSKWIRQIHSSNGHMTGYPLLYFPLRPFWRLPTSAKITTEAGIQKSV